MPDLVALRQRIMNLVCHDALQMVETTIEQVEDGHYQALKYLFEMVGLYPAASVPEPTEEDCLAGVLLKRLGLASEPNSSSEQRDFTSQPRMLDGDAVK